MRRRCESLLNAGMLVALAVGGVSCEEKGNGGSGGGEETASDDGSGSDDGDGGDGGSGDDGGSDDGGSGDDGTGADDGDDDGGSDGGDATDDDDGGAFLAEPDGGGLEECDPGLQDCSNPDEKCTAYLLEPGGCCVDANKCVPIIGHKRGGELCTRTEMNDDCDKGFFCMTRNSAHTGEGVCFEFCVPDSDGQCMETGGECSNFNGGVLPLCILKCDPLLQDCPQNLGCYGDHELDVFICLHPGYEEGSGRDGDECPHLMSCEPGLVCVDPPWVVGCSDPCCTPLCDLSEPDPCMPPEECLAWFEPGEAPPGLEDVGACMIPP
jgi:hypothetical protein